MTNNRPPAFWFVSGFLTGGVFVWVMVLALVHIGVLSL